MFESNGSCDRQQKNVASFRLWGTHRMKHAALRIEVRIRPQSEKADVRPQCAVGEYRVVASSSGAMRECSAGVSNRPLKLTDRPCHVAGRASAAPSPPAA